MKSWRSKNKNKIGEIGEINKNLYHWRTVATAVRALQIQENLSRQKRNTCTGWKEIYLLSTGKDLSLTQQQCRALEDFNKFVTLLFEAAPQRRNTSSEAGSNVFSTTSPHFKTRSRGWNCQWPWCAPWKRRRKNREIWRTGEERKQQNKKKKKEHSRYLQLQSQPLWVWYEQKKKPIRVTTPLANK